ncbi:MAG: hypothetical protein V3S91_02990 [Gemmatimonadota bacterium]
MVPLPNAHPHRELPMNPRSIPRVLAPVTALLIVLISAGGCGNLPTSPDPEAASPTEKSEQPQQMLLGDKKGMGME